MKAYDRYSCDVIVTATTPLGGPTHRLVAVDVIATSITQAEKFAVDAMRISADPREQFETVAVKRRDKIYAEWRVLTA